MLEIGFTRSTFNILTPLTLSLEKLYYGEEEKEKFNILNISVVSGKRRITKTNVFLIYSFSQKKKEPSQKNIMFMLFIISCLA